MLHLRIARLLEVEDQAVCKNGGEANNRLIGDVVGKLKAVMLTRAGKNQ